ncbi:MAG TPA: molybdopterin-dependent oxidoreductase [Syntrophomonadaceae bacterium]|nr:molybdopterin-dependent oxidoreductase [Syntrophomonadaceae bacterium]
MKDIEKLMRGKIPGPDTGIEVHKSVCTICDPLTQCGLDLYVKDGEIIKVEGTKENPYSNGTLCSKGAAMRQYVYSGDRLKTPLKRVGPRGSGEYEPISWEEALNTIAEKFNQVKEEYGPESVAFYSGYAKWHRPFLHRLAHAFGSPNYLTESSTCYQAMAMSQKLVFGTPGGPDIKNSKCLLIWSANPFYSNTGNVLHILRAKEKGLKIICVDPRYTPTAAQADIHLQLKPGTDGALALGMAHVIINENLYDQDFVNKYTHGFKEYKEYVQEFTPEKAAEITGVPAQTIKAAARMYATVKPASIMPSASPVVHHTNGVQNYRAVFSLAGLTGNYDVYGGNFVQPMSYLYITAGFKGREVEFTMPKTWDELPPRIGQEEFPAWSELVDEAQAMRLPFQIKSGKPYPIKAMIGFGLNYRMWPDSNFMRESLEEIDFFVNVDLFNTDTGQYADIILPACSSVERSELRCYAQRYIIYTQPAIEPIGESRDDVSIILDLAEKLGIDDPLFNQGYEACLDWMIEPSGMKIEELKKHPGGMPIRNPMQIPEKKYVENGFTTPSGKLEFVSTRLEKYQESYGYEALPAYNHPKYSLANTPEMAEKYPFILNTGSRLPMFAHTRTFRLSWTKSLRPEIAVDIHPSDAENLGIKQDDDLKIVTIKGSITVKANLTKMARPGVVYMYHGHSEADVNQLFEADYYDPISGFPGYKSSLCNLEKV